MRKSDKNKKAKAHFRSSERFFREDGEWFFQTREGARGPFRTREIAEQELRRFTDTMEFVEDNENHLPSGVNWKDVTIVEIDQLPGELRRQ